MELVVAIIIASALYIVSGKLYKRLWDKNLQVKISFKDDYVRAGDKTGLEVMINNDKFLPMPVVHVKYACPKSFVYDDLENSTLTDYYHRNDAFSIMGGQKITRTLNFSPSARGYFNIESVNLITKDLFMTTTFAKVMENSSALYVLPKKRYQQEVETFLNSLLGEIYSMKSLFEDPYSFRGIREYRTSDHMNAINHKASAKEDKLMVNMYEKTTEQKIKLMLNLETNSMVKIKDIQEISIDLTSTIAEYLAEEKIPISIVTNGADVVTGENCQVGFGADYNHLIVGEKCLARITDNLGLDSFFALLDKEVRGEDYSISYVIVSPYYKDDLLLKLDYLVSKGINCYLICPYYDIQKYVPLRDYMHGLEVKLVET